MNVFRKKGRAKDDAYIIPPAVPSESATLAKMSRSLKRKQKNVAERKPEIDLSTALPDSNNFRTSLLMPGLSARFSMLREQDDPSTLVGKASDDSVLFPKRASRLNLFSHNPLTDIAEVGSIHTTIRAPFAQADRSHSFSEGAGYKTDDDAGSVSARSRATDGSSLFGGRPQMYKLGNGGSSRDLIEGAAPPTTSRQLYQDDATRTPHSGTRVKGREEREPDESGERPISAATEDHERSSVVNTPSTGFSKSRGTISSIASGPSNRRTSTAATSVISDSPVPRQSNISSGSNPRVRAPDFGNDGNLLRRNLSSDSRKPGQPSDNQNQPPLPISPIPNRQVSLSISPTAPPSDKHGVEESPLATGPLRRPSPPLPAEETRILIPLDFGLKTTKSQVRRYQTASPTNDNGDTNVYHQSLEPNDRGKATAMGLFNRPRQQFDEQKFQERQLQMHEGRIAPSARNNPEHDGMLEQQREPINSMAIGPSSPLNNNFDASNFNRRRAQSNASVKPAQVHAKVEELIKRQNEEYTAIQACKSEPAKTTASVSQQKDLTDQVAASNGTFLDTFDGSDDDAEADLDSPMFGRYEPAPRLAALDIHPALRNGSQTFDFGDQVTSSSQPTRPPSNLSVQTSTPSGLDDKDVLDTTDLLHRSAQMKDTDSPTLGPTTGLGLSGLIRTHLRHDSDRSSLMPPPSPVPPTRAPSRFPGFRERELSVASTARTLNPPASTHSDPWEFDNAHKPQRSPLESPSNEPTSLMSQKAQQILGQAISHRNQATTKVQEAIGTDSPASDNHTSSQQWQTDLMHNHQRGESTETQKEFGNELAERAKKIQEGLKGVAEVEKSSRSPVMTHDRHHPAAQALQALRHKASKASLAPRSNEPHPKAMKMLGLSGLPRPEMVGRSPTVGARGNFAFEQGFDDHGIGSNSRERQPGYQAPSGRRTPGPGLPMPHGNNPHGDFERSRQRSATPTSGRTSRRDRGGADHVDRSRSRPGRRREEHQVAGTDRGRHGPPPTWEHQGSRGGAPGQPGQHGPRGPYPGQRGPPPVDPRNYERSASAMSNSRTSGSRPEPSEPLESRASTPALAGTPHLGNGQTHPVINPPRPSPRPPFPHSPMSPFGHPGLSPGFSGPASAVQSALPSPIGPLPPPPSTGRSTPVEGRPTGAGARKKSVTKGMISEPTFISSTSSVPLVGLPRGPRPTQIATPPIPAMNPRRRGTTVSEKTDVQPSPLMIQSPMSPFPDSPGTFTVGGIPDQNPSMEQQQQKPVPRQRNRLRKISSEGGNLAARARQQAMMSEFGHERLRSPALPVFPNRSATSLGMHHDGGMF
ncbi:hypothetical protein A1O1_03409 [Capronia coronata CBS 617.96]|uniref:Uncharacterized protein n=1 Tax=Capronia coronata CBS 617.96 TaxID=1182541 RepID=W9YKU6_9EURO|nr:uncharacterized protein A1O1_03409 [Capronia coronata CBS 617.96]EXJ90310.1 hypothetical protein A1O1_03409 [Capronia coronata CBS 617.96]